LKNKDIPKPELATPKSTLTFIWAIVAGVIGFLLYANTMGNGYVLDDNYAITKNLFVQEGISGIPKLFTVDFWYFENVKLGYYRPLGLATFAIEHEFFGNNPLVSHFDNALLYGISGFVLCLFLLEFMKSKHPAFAFLIALVFLAHPIHTEVVANIKSRDEILSFLNIFATMYFVFRYQKTKKKPALVWSLIFFYLALLSKETALVGVILLPLFLYYAGNAIPAALKKALPYAGVAIFFFLQKRYFLGSDNTILPTVFHIFALCLSRLVFPWPLSYDYSYNQVPASHWADGGAWLGLGLFGIMAFVAIKGIIKKDYWGLGLSIVFITLVPSMAFVFLRGGIMAERFLYAPCLGFAIMLVYALSLAFPKPENVRVTLPEWLKNNAILTSIVVFVCIVYSIETVARNKVWKDQLTLFGTDTKHSPNSVQVHKHYGTALLEAGRFEKDSAKRRQDFDLGMGEMQKAIAIYPTFADAYYEMGFGYQLVEINFDSAIKYYKLCFEYASAYAMAYNNIGIIYQTRGNFALASYYYNKAVEANPQFPDGVQNAANIKKTTGFDVHIFPGEDPKTVNAKTLADSSLPENVKKFTIYSAKGAEAVNKGDFAAGIKNFKKAAELVPDNKQNLIYLANSYGMAKRYQDAVNTFEKILKLYPDDQLALKNLYLTYTAMGQMDKADEVRKRIN
jgi:tetratricopeptide (TPR) repeat protein